MKFLYKIFLSILFAAGMFLLFTPKAFAATDCVTLTISPEEGTSITSFTITGFGCAGNTNYQIVLIRQSDRQEVYTDYETTDRDGNYLIRFQAPAPEEYIARVQVIGNPNSTDLPFSVKEDTPPPTSYSCGQIVPTGTFNANCPASPYCPLNSIPPDLGVSGQWCGCGDYNLGCCPEGNSLNQAPCRTGLVCQGGTCVIDDDTTGTSRYFCGEMVRPEHADNFQCVGGCQPEVLAQPGPEGEQYWCSCGRERQRCCPGPFDTPQCDGDCNFVPDLKSCITANLACNEGVCAPSDPEPYLCIDGLSLMTAIGCIPLINITELTVFLIRWSTGIVGGITVLVFIFAGLRILTSSGDPEQLEQGRNLLTSAIAAVLMIIFCLILLRIIGVSILGVL